MKTLRFKNSELFHPMADQVSIVRCRSRILSVMWTLTLTTLSILVPWITSSSVLYTNSGLNLQSQNIISTSNHKTRDKNVLIRKPLTRQLTTKIVYSGGASIKASTVPLYSLHCCVLDLNLLRFSNAYAEHADG